MRSFKTSTTKPIAITVERVYAQLDLKNAQLEADHLRNRIEEQSVIMASEREQKMQMHPQKMLMPQQEPRRKIELAQQRCENLGEIDRFSEKSLQISPKVSKCAHTKVSTCTHNVGTSCIEPRNKINIRNGNLKSIAAMGEYTLFCISFFLVEVKRLLQNNTYSKGEINLMQVHL